MAAWKTGELGEFITLKRGYDLPQQKRKNGSVPIFSSSGISGTHDTAMVKAPGVITGRYGTIGQVFMADKDFWPLNTTLYVKDFHGNNPRFIYYFLKTLGWEKFTSASAVPGINRNTVHKETICLPDIASQDKIASVLTTLDDKIEINEKINDNLYEMVNAYYISLFKGDEGEMTTVGNYAERIYSGGTPTTSNADYWNGTFGWFSSGETRNRFVISTEKTITQAGIDNSSTKLATKYDIVMASAGQGFTRGQTSMLLVDTYVNQSVIVIHSERNILPYLFWNLANRYDELRAISDSSSIRGSLTTKMIAAFEISLANEQSLQTFADFAWPVIPQIENNLLENERLTALRDSLLPKLMSGEIDVSDIQL